MMSLFDVFHHLLLHGNVTANCYTTMLTCWQQCLCWQSWWWMIFVISLSMKFVEVRVIPAAAKWGHSPDLPPPKHETRRTFSVVSPGRYAGPTGKLNLQPSSNLGSPGRCDVPIQIKNGVGASRGASHSSRSMFSTRGCTNLPLHSIGYWLIVTYKANARIASGVRQQVDLWRSKQRTHEASHTFFWSYFWGHGSENIDLIPRLKIVSTRATVNVDITLILHPS